MSAAAELLARLARELANQQDRDAVLRRVVTVAVDQIDGAEHAGITVLTRSSVSTPVATDELVAAIDRHQYAAGEGPCLTAATEQVPVVVVEDLHADDRWPTFTAAVAGLGVRSMMSFQLYTDEGEPADTIGALNVYAAGPDAFGEESVHTGALVAAHAAVAAAAAANRDNLRLALQTRDVIGRAKGILMERYKVTDQQAFDLLVAVSQRTNRKLREVADRLAATGDLGVD